VQFRHRQRRPARQPAFRTPKRRILIVTEGAVTEKKYLEGLIFACKNPCVEFKVMGGVGVPMTIVETAIRSKRSAAERSRLEKDRNLEFEEVWCVFDVDQHPKIPEARKLAEQNRIELAISNPCFELWLWLHFEDSPGPRSAQELLDMLKRYLPDYKKHVRFAEVRQGYLSAVNRAQGLEQQAVGMEDVGRNPSTGVWRLTESIRLNSFNGSNASIGGSLDTF
jgi:hypothetical protein